MKLNPNNSDLQPIDYLHCKFDVSRKDVNYRSCSLPNGSIYIDFEDNVWVGLFQGLYGVYNGKNWSFSQNQFEEFVRTFAQPNSSEIWIGTSDGIYIAGTEQ